MSSGYSCPLRFPAGLGVSNSRDVLIVDEVQSGMGLTGQMFASDHFDLQATRHIAKGSPRAAAWRDVRARGESVVAPARTRARLAAIRSPALRPTDHHFSGVVGGQRRRRRA